MKKVFNFTLILFLFTISSCAKQEFILSDNRGRMTENKTSHFFVAGIGQSTTINVTEICGSIDKVASFESQLSFINIFITQLASSIYAPKQARVYCTN